MTAQEALVERINGLCKKHRISVNHLATLAGMNPSTMKKYSIWAHPEYRGGDGGENMLRPEYVVDGFL